MNSSPPDTPPKPTGLRVQPTFASQSALEQAIQEATATGTTKTRVMVFAGLKGGLGKTTSAMALALALHAIGLSVVVIDADPLSQTARTWAADCESQSDPLPFRVVGYAMTGLAEYVTNEFIGLLDVVIIDTGADGERLMRDACRIADDLVMVMGPDDADLKRLPATWQTAHLVAAETGRAFSAHVLLVRCPTSSTMKAAAVENLAKVGITPLSVSVPQAVMYRRMSGTHPQDIGAYTYVAEELTREETTA